MHICARHGGQQEPCHIGMALVSASMQRSSPLAIDDGGRGAGLEQYLHACLVATIGGDQQRRAADMVGSRGICTAQEK